MSQPPQKEERREQYEPAARKMDVDEDYDDSGDDDKRSAAKSKSEKNSPRGTNGNGTNGPRHGPPFIRRISSLLSTRLTTWQTFVIILLQLYVARNFGKLVGLECPEPLANLYTRSYFRATWVTTALDAGFWSAMRIRRKWARDIASIVFTIYYLICAEQADEKVRKVRSTLTVEHLRVSWDKPTTPVIAFFTKLMRPKLMRYPPRAIRIPRPQESSYEEPVHGWLYFDGPLSALKKHNKVVLDIPGGGFVAMNPRDHDDKLLAWAGRTGLPVLSLDYKKAPEYPYPHALNECYDVYHTLITSRGRCIGLSGDSIPKVVVTGDSAGGNLAVGLVLMILQSGSTDTRRWQGEEHLPIPEGMVLVYPALDMNIGNWMTDEQMALIRDRKTRKTNRGVLRRKSDDYRKLTPDTPHHSDNEDDPPSPPKLSSSNSARLLHEALTISSTSKPSDALHPSAAHTIDTTTTSAQTSKPQPLKTRLAMSSMISYFNDRILTPEMMRAMIILYIGPYNRPDFSTDFLLSPLLAPESLLARFPKLHICTGERDPLVDDTVIFAGRIRQAKAAAFLSRQELGLEDARARFDEAQHVEVMLVPGISHGFLQFVSVFPEGWKYIFRCSRWMLDLFAAADARDTEAEGDAAEGRDYFSSPHGRANGTAASNSTVRHHRRMRTESSGDEDRPLEMSNSARLSPRGKNGLGGGGGGGGGGRVGRNGGGRARYRDRGMVPSRKSLVSLASEDDLLSRRMKGLTGGLMGSKSVPDTP
ncbi:hypothetical protein B0A49_11471 [Cryomyces minteri]|uniref:Alpha/beta hydrolase fold-3 domain-containing protein n=1 Tax=Cryomyces minteri TaxID=331657 RepID=A0A4U0WXS0_9PEZI|nr:hypothetical protein B0A49_11471 [Cryomyces minteri]